MPDTLKAQHIARLTEGFVLYSDMGRILCSIIEDTVGWHDRLRDVPTRRWSRRATERRAIRSAGTTITRMGATAFLVELGKWGLGPRDLIANVNFFSHVDVADDGSMNLPCGELRAWLVRGPSRRDERADDSEYVPAPSRSESEIRPEARPPVDPARAPRVLTTLAGFHAPRMDALYADGTLFFCRAGGRHERNRGSNLDAANGPVPRRHSGWGPWVHEIGQGQHFRIVDLGGNQAVDTLSTMRTTIPTVSAPKIPFANSGTST